MLKQIWPSGTSDSVFEMYLAHSIYLFFQPWTKKRTIMPKFKFQIFGRHLAPATKYHKITPLQIWKYDHSIWTIQIGKVIYNLLSHSLLSLISTELNIWWAIDTQIFPSHILILGPQCWCVHRFLSGFIGFSYLSLSAVGKRQLLCKNPQSFHFGDPIVGDIISLQKSSLGILISKIML